MINWSAHAARCQMTKRLCSPLQPPRHRLLQAIDSFWGHSIASDQVLVRSLDIVSCCKHSMPSLSFRDTLLGRDAVLLLLHCGNRSATLRVVLRHALLGLPTDPERGVATIVVRIQ
eukprot:1487117-Amphidinium_carterae.1